LGTNISEVFAHAMLENNYFAWLYDYKNKNQDAPYTLNTTWLNKKMKIQMTMMTNRSSVVSWTKLKLLCLRMMVVTMAELVFDEGPTKTQAKAAAEEVAKKGCSFKSI
jgi:hypothetical protein